MRRRPPQRALSALKLPRFPPRSGGNIENRISAIFLSSKPSQPYLNTEPEPPDGLIWLLGNKSELWPQTADDGGSSSEKMGSFYSRGAPAGGNLVMDSQSSGLFGAERGARWGSGGPAGVGWPQTLSEQPQTRGIPRPPVGRGFAASRGVPRGDEVWGGKSSVRESPSRISWE